MGKTVKPWLVLASPLLSIRHYLLKISALSRIGPPAGNYVGKHVNLCFTLKQDRDSGSSTTKAQGWTLESLLINRTKAMPSPASSQTAALQNVIVSSELPGSEIKKGEMLADQNALWVKQTTAV